MQMWEGVKLTTLNWPLQKDVDFRVTDTSFLGNRYGGTLLGPILLTIAPLNYIY